MRFVPILVLFFIMPVICKADPIDKIAELIRQGNMHELASLFAANVDVSILDDANVYSKVQAELILEKFFKENKPQSVKILHRINSNAAYNFGVFILNTDRGKFRVAVTLKEVARAMVIIDLRIETEKT